MLGLHFCARALSSCGKRGPLSIAVRGPLTIVASLVAEHKLQTRRLSNCGSRAQPLRGMWDPPRPGLKPVSPALAGRLSTTAPPGKPGCAVLKKIKFNTHGWSHFLSNYFFITIVTNRNFSMTHYAKGTVLGPHQKRVKSVRHSSYPQGRLGDEVRQVTES